MSGERAASVATMKRLFHGRTHSPGGQSLKPSSMNLSLPLRASIEDKEIRLEAWPVLGIALMQLLLLAAHWFIYRTWIDFWWPLGPWAVRALLMALVLLAFQLHPPPRCSASTSPTRWSGSSTGLPPSGWDYSTSSSWPPASRAGLVHAEAPATASGPSAASRRALRFGCRDGNLRPGERPLHSHPAHSGPTGRPAPLLARPHPLVLTDLHLGHLNGPRFSCRIMALAASLNPTLSSSPATSSTARGLMPRS